MWQWAQDSGFTPQLLVDATVAEVVVPVASVESGRIVLNVHDRAVVDLLSGENALIVFNKVDLPHRRRRTLHHGTFISHTFSTPQPLPAAFEPR